MADIYRLVVDYAGNGMRDRLVITADKLDDLVPSIRAIGADMVEFERYGPEEDYVEVRSDFVVSRSLVLIKDDDDEHRPGRVAPVTRLGPKLGGDD